MPAVYPKRSRRGQKMQWPRLFECIVKNLGKAIQKRPAPLRKPFVLLPE